MTVFHPSTSFLKTVLACRRAVCGKYELQIGAVGETAFHHTNNVFQDDKRSTNYPRGDFTNEQRPNLRYYSPDRMILINFQTKEEV